MADSSSKRSPRGRAPIGAKAGQRIVHIQCGDRRFDLSLAGFSMGAVRTLAGIPLDRAASIGNKLVDDGYVLKPEDQLHFRTVWTGISTSF